MLLADAAGSVVTQGTDRNEPPAELLLEVSIIAVTKWVMSGRRTVKEGVVVICR